MKNVACMSALQLQVVQNTVCMSTSFARQETELGDLMDDLITIFIIRESDNTPIQ